MLKWLACVVLSLLVVWPAAAQQSYAKALQNVAPSLLGVIAQTENGLSEGSGLIVAPEGMVLTSRHVVAGGNSFSARLPDGSLVPLTLVAEDASHDVALLQLPPSPLAFPAVPLTPKTYQPGDVVLAAGSTPNGPTLSAGIISVVRRGQVLNNPYQLFIQTDAAINPGNSGGVLIDTTGAVVGLIAASASAERGVAFALPTETLAALLADWQRNPITRRAWLGAEGRALAPADATDVGLNTTQGVLITTVLPGSPAEAAGIQINDVVQRLNGQPVLDAARFSKHVSELRTWLGKPVALDIWRNGKSYALKVQLEQLPNRRSAEAQIMRGYNPLSGVTVEPVSPALATELGVPMTTSGVVITRLSDTPLGTFASTFAVGDIIQLINGQPTATARAAQGALNTSRRAWEVRYLRDGRVKLVKF